MNIRPPPAGLQPRFADLVDVPALQALMDSVHALTGIANAVIDLDGVVITQSGWQDVCTGFHRVNPDTRRRCIESDTSLARSMTCGERFARYNCLNGLVDTAAPIIVDGEHVANVFTGQFFTAPPDTEFFRRQAREFGFDEARYLEAVARVPVLPEDRVGAVTGVYVQLAQVLAANGFDRLRQLRGEEELRQLNAGLQQRSAELEAANRELEDFSYSVSHDLRTPLRAIAGFAQILAEEYGPRLDDEGRRLLGVVRGNTVRMGELIDAILHFLKLGRQKLEHVEVDMAQLAREEFARLQAAAPYRRLRFDVKPLPVARGDRAMLRELLANLLSNAVKFTQATSEALIEVGGAEENDELLYYVKDNGVGFDMKYVDKLFRLFERVHSTGEYEGTAVGLALVKRIASRHGGRVWAEGAVGAGATVHFALPRKEPGK